MRLQQTICMKSDLGESNSFANELKISDHLPSRSVFNNAIVTFIDASRVRVPSVHGYGSDHLCANQSHSSENISSTHNSNWYIYPLFPPKSTAQPNLLHRFSIENLHRRLKTLLGNAGVEIALGGIDFSFNTHKDLLYGPHWCPHAFLITSTTDFDPQCAMVLFPAAGWSNLTRPPSFGGAPAIRPWLLRVRLTCRFQ